jgi:transposase
MSQHSTTASSTPEPVLAAGIDVSKGWLDAALSSGHVFKRCGNDEAGFASLIADFRRAGVTRVGLEATGGYEAGLFRALREAGFEAAHLQPLQVRGYAQFTLRRAKTDRLDALVIAHCTQALKSVRSAPDPRLHALGAHMTLIEQIGEDMARAKTRLEHARCEEALAHHKAMIRELRQRQARELKCLSAKIAAHQDLGEKLRLVMSIDGIGLKTAVCLVIRMPELASAGRGQAASLLGAAPVKRQSGTFKGEEHVAGGRKRPRTALFACAQAALFHNPQLKAFYARLKAKGKHHRVAIMACTRKLVIFVTTVLNRKTPWTSSSSSQAA